MTIFDQNCTLKHDLTLCQFIFRLETQKLNGIQIVGKIVIHYV